LSWTEIKILNPSRSDFKYPSDFGFLKNCRIPSDSDADLESVTSLVNLEFVVDNNLLNEMSVLVIVWSVFKLYICSEFLNTSSSLWSLALFGFRENSKEY